MQGLMNFFDQTYQLMQKLYSQQTVSAWIERGSKIFEGQSGGQMKRGLIGLLVGVALAAIVIDLVFYWTREDQLGRLRRIVSRCKAWLHKSGEGRA